MACAVLSESSLTYTGWVHTSQGRAKPLPPDDRRREIVDAIIPLLLEKGSSLSTREIADAAGVAEGTVFSVFPTKASVIVEAVKATVDAEAICEAIGNIPETWSIDEQLREATILLMERGKRIGILVGVLRTTQPSSRGKPPEAFRFLAESHAAIQAVLTDLFARHTPRLATEPGRAADVLWALVFSSGHSLLGFRSEFDASGIVDVVLHGVTRHGSGYGS